MIVDSSAIVAILRNEPESSAFREALEAAAKPKMSAVSYVETGAVVDSPRDPIVTRQLDELLREAQIEIQPVTIQQAFLARQAYRDFGKGSGHAARLNLADCFSYALAKDLGEPLLFKGGDFSQTDVEIAIPSREDH